MVILRKSMNVVCRLYALSIEIFVFLENKRDKDFFRFSVLVERAKVIVFKISPKSVTYVAYLLNCFYNNKF